jgi:hypothetical protein
LIPEIGVILAKSPHRPMLDRSMRSTRREILANLAAASFAWRAGNALLSASVHAQQAKGKILIVLSSETSLPLRDGKTFDTGCYLNEIIVPAERFAAAGYELVFTDVP